MAGGIIKDGTGSGNSASVDLSNKLDTRSVTSETTHEAAEAGDAVFIGSTALTLTSCCASAILFFQNDACRDLIITEIFFSLGSSTGGTGSALYTFTKNATGLSSSEGNAAIANPNLGSSTVFCSTSEKGVEAATVTGGCLLSAFFIALDGTTVLPATIVIPKGNSVAVQVTPPASNSSLVVAVGLRAYYIKDL